MRTRETISILLADEVWIATALLHKENPARSDFTISEIVARVDEEGILGEVRRGTRAHVTQHCVANRQRQTGRYRMLYQTGKHTRRLYRPRDQYHSSRQGGKITPAREDIPARYRHLLDWYHEEYVKNAPHEEEDSILALRGLGKGLWADEHPDDYVRRLRQGWE